MDHAHPTEGETHHMAVAAAATVPEAMDHTTTHLLHDGMAHHHHDAIPKADENEVDLSGLSALDVAAMAVSKQKTLPQQAHLHQQFFPGGDAQQQQPQHHQHHEHQQQHCTTEAAAAATYPPDLATTATAAEVRSPPHKKRKLCRFPGCDRVVKSQGHCQRHGARAKRCKVEGCEKQAQGTHDGMCKRHWKAANFPDEANKKAPPPAPEPEGDSVYDSILPMSIAYRPMQQKQGGEDANQPMSPSGQQKQDLLDPPAAPDGFQVMPLVAHLKEGIVSGKPAGWHRNEERRARGILPVKGLSVQLEPWERQLALVEILLLSGGTPFANFKELAFAWGREKGFHHVLANSVCERRGEVERKKRSDAGKSMTEEERQAFRSKLQKARDKNGTSKKAKTEALRAETAKLPAEGGNFVAETGPPNKLEAASEPEAGILGPGDSIAAAAPPAQPACPPLHAGPNAAAVVLNAMESERALETIHMVADGSGQGGINAAAAGVTLHGPQDEVAALGIAQIGAPPNIQQHIQHPLPDHEKAQQPAAVQQPGAFVGAAAGDEQKDDNGLANAAMAVDVVLV